MCFCWKNVFQSCNFNAVQISFKYFLMFKKNYRNMRQRLWGWLFSPDRSIRHGPNKIINSEIEDRCNSFWKFENNESPNFPKPKRWLGFYFSFKLVKNCYSVSKIFTASTWRYFSIFFDWVYSNSNFVFFFF